MFSAKFKLISSSIKNRNIWDDQQSEDESAKFELLADIQLQPSKQYDVNLLKKHPHIVFLSRTKTEELDKLFSGFNVESRPRSQKMNILLRQKYDIIAT